MRCSCGGRIKKGVDFRISEIADYDKPKHPDHRPPYIHLMPLAEIISMAYDKGVTTKKVQGKWQSLIDAFGPEIEVLLNTPLEEIAKIDDEIPQAISAFRNRTINVVPGGGGKYGEISFNKELPEREVESKPKVTLDDF